MRNILRNIGNEMSLMLRRPCAVITWLAMCFLYCGILLTTSIRLLTVTSFRRCMILPILPRCLCGQKADSF